MRFTTTAHRHPLIGRSSARCGYQAAQRRLGPKENAWWSKVPARRDWNRQADAGDALNVKTTNRTAKKTLDLCAVTLNDRGKNDDRRGMDIWQL